MVLFIGKRLNGIDVHDSVVASQFLQRDDDLTRDFHRARLTIWRLWASDEYAPQWADW